MKKATEIKYPQSANLFQFCRRVLDHKFGKVRVIDQDIGQILGFDPADCSHWKKGKKNVRSIQAMKLIAEHLGIDEKLVIDVASGELSDTEAYCELSGYGSFDIDLKSLETAKKDYYRRHSNNWSKEKETEFKAATSINEPLIDEAVASIHKKINFKEAPLYLPEISTAYQSLELIAIDQPVEKINDLRETVTIKTKDGVHQIYYFKGSELKPFTRFRIAKAMANHFLPDLNTQTAGISEFIDHMTDVQSNLFAAKLLAPLPLIRKEISQVDVSRDVVMQLAESFWVSKSFMNRRLKDILQGSMIL